MADTQSPLSIATQASCSPTIEAELAVRIVVLKLCERWNRVYELTFEIPGSLKIHLIGDEVGEQVITISRELVDAEVLGILCKHLKPVVTQVADAASNLLSSPAGLSTIFKKHSRATS